MPIGQKQRAAGLQFLLYDRPVHPEFFDIYHDHRIAKRRYEAQIWVTGISHVIGFFGGGSVLTELIAQGRAVLPERGRLVALPLRGEKKHETGQCPGLRYLMNFQVETLSPRLYAKAHHDLARHGSQRGIFVPFPQWTSNSLVPFTYIDYEAKADQLHVFAHHAFVDELTLITTLSIFELVEKA
jgi:xanthine/CO dehydrogenase XdhC/CoxF family maturation factor